jgi:hypothetical protein
MAIGTAKPNATELAAVKHHFIDSHTVTQLFSTGDFEVEGLKTLEEIFQKHDLAIMVGGSGLYVNALLNGLDEMPDIDLSIREKLNKQFEEEGLAVIQNQLAELDPEYFAKVDQQNPQRMIRGLEVFLSTGQKLSSMLSATKKERPFNIIKIGLNTDRAILYDRINRRVDKMIADGLAGLGGSSVVLLTSTLNSPSSKQVIAEFLAKFPGSHHVQYDSISFSGMLLANEATYGKRAIPSYHFEKAKVVVSLNADFLGTWLSPVEFQKGYTALFCIQFINNTSLYKG